MSETKQPPNSRKTTAQLPQSKSRSLC
jgi:hypothetical protein